MDLQKLMQEYLELEKQESEILAELETLKDVRGCIVLKEIPYEDKKYEYYYLVWKEGGKVKWKLLGKQYPKDLAEKLQKKRDLKKRLNEIRKRKKELKKLIKGLL